MAELVYRADGRPPGEIFEEGFQLYNDHNSGLGLGRYAQFNEHGPFISTTRSWQSVLGFARRPGAGKQESLVYIYTIVIPDDRPIWEPEKIRFTDHETFEIPEELRRTEKNGYGQDVMPKESSNSVGPNLYVQQREVAVKGGIDPNIIFNCIEYKIAKINGENEVSINSITPNKKYTGQDKITINNVFYDLEKIMRGLS
ncbi:scabin-related ADP-ribosyltransferase [Acetobacter sp.]|jgi:hypothetical protein|uniref:scabin-related ADP-ribosyltransferase n=1 Tax=Acetobacter sp. TaxID=440 RepID=UPI0025BAD7A7|nr:hypothetical protein [Acetobacter sp.]MCH4090216.1 hypothetical protein [Acetobacter sp.]MCI1298910.1 hypothetical protein [Acetobacter sp.]MCI1314930.1 hypothetical protein [Acetobacter sp.]